MHRHIPTDVHFQQAVPSRQCGTWQFGSAQCTPFWVQQIEPHIHHTHAWRPPIWPLLRDSWNRIRAQSGGTAEFLSLHIRSSWSHGVPQHVLSSLLVQTVIYDRHLRVVQERSAMRECVCLCGLMRSALPIRFERLVYPTARALPE